MNYPKIVTPRGTAIWPRLNEPDTKYNPAGKFEAKIAIEPDADGLAAMQAQVDKLLDAKYDEVIAEQTDKLIKAGKKGLVDKFVESLTKRSPFTPEVDGETGEETGRLLVKAGMTATGVSQKTGKPWSRKPLIVNGKGVKIANPPSIGSGSVMKLNVELFPYYAPNDKTVGVSLRLEGAQVIKLVSFGERDAASMGFGAEEDGDDFGDAEVTGGGVAGDVDNEDDDQL